MFDFITSSNQLCHLSFVFVCAEDDVYHQLKSVFLASGKGRRPNLPSVQLTNKLLMQILRLKDEGEKSFDQAAAFLCKLLPESDTTFARLRYKLVSFQAK